MAISAWTNLASGKGEPDYAELGREFRDCQVSLILHTPSWEKYLPIASLSWDKVKYDSAKAPADRRGVYAFVLDSSVVTAGPFPPLAVILYIGETGNTGAETLRSRLRGYRNKKSQRDRARIWRMLERWEERLEFYYAVVPVGTSTKACETSLLDALLPPLNKKDFSATVSLAREAAF
jgi:hypothetical protein